MFKCSILCLTTPLRHLVSARNDERMNSDFFFKYFYAGIVQSNLCWNVNLHNSKPAMNYFDSNKTNTVIFNHSWTVYTQHLVAVPFTSFRNFELILSIINNCSSVRYYVWQLRSAILLALEMMNEWTPMNYFDSNRTNTVIFNLSWTVCTRHLVAVPFTHLVSARNDERMNSDFF
jgi:hypothetical protein